MSTADLKNVPKARGKKPKLLILCCDISLRNELAIGHETGDVTLWKIDVINERCTFLAIVNLDYCAIKQVEFNSAVTLLRSGRDKT